MSMFRTLRPHKSHDMKQNELYAGNSYCTQCGLLSTKEAIERICRHEATKRIEDLDGLVRAAVAELNIIRQIAHSDPDRAKMLAENAIEFLRNGIERQ